MNFRLWLESNQWINPDHSYTHFKDDKRTVPFIYTNDGRMFYPKKKWLPPSNYIHSDIMYQNNIADRYDDKKDKDDYIDREAVSNYDLLGRVGPIQGNADVLVVSFWGSNEILFNQLIHPCLQQLAKDGLIDLHRDAISTVNHGTVLIKDMDAANKASDKDVETQRMMQQLHLMGSPEKRNAMQKLGLATGNKKNAWDKAANDNGLTQPGQKFWAINSENTKS